MKIQEWIVKKAFSFIFSLLSFLRNFDLERVRYSNFLQKKSKNAYFSSRNAILTGVQGIQHMLGPGPQPLAVERVNVAEAFKRGRLCAEQLFHF